MASLQAWIEAGVVIVLVLCIGFIIRRGYCVKVIWCQLICLFQSVESDVSVDLAERWRMPQQAARSFISNRISALS